VSVITYIVQSSRLLTRSRKVCVCIPRGTKDINTVHLLYTSIDQKLLNCEIGRLDCRVITAEFRTRVHCIHMHYLFCNALVHAIYLGVSGQCLYIIRKQRVNVSNFKYMILIF